MLQWSEVQIFLAVARAGSLQRASARLGVDRTTVGRRLSAMERRLGSPLFLRARSGLTLTAAGSRAVEHASAMDAAARTLEAEVVPPAQVSGLVRIATTEGVAPFLVQEGLLALTAEHPGLSLELLAGNRRVDLLAGEVDLAVRMDPLTGADLRARCLDRSPVALYAAAPYLARRGAPRARRLAGHDALVPGGELSRLPEARWLKAQGVRVSFSSDSYPALVAAARAGAGVLSLSEAWGAREPALTKLFDLPLAPRAVWLVSTASAARLPAVKVVSARLAELFRRR